MSVTNLLQTLFLFIADKLRNMIVEVRKPEIGIAYPAKLLYVISHPWNTWHIDKGKLKISQRDIVIGNVEPYTKLG